MYRHAKGLVSLLLPIVPLAFYGCGGGGDSDSSGAAPVAQAPVAPAAANRAPSLAGTAGEFARIGETYVFQPQATDPDGDAMSFSATNLPPWASLDPTSGRLSGTPGPTDEGIYESITIVVADAVRRTESAPFSITVFADVASEAATGVASLRWELPPSKLDGSPLDDLAGFRIKYGRDENDLDQSVLVNDPTVTTYEFNSLQSGIWYFAVVAVNASGLEGPPTTTTMKSI
jgi:hypothetical protein